MCIQEATRVQGNVVCNVFDLCGADTLRKHGQQQGGASDGSPQALSPDPQQEPFYPNRVLADLYGSSLASSKSEPNGDFILSFACSLNNNNSNNNSNNNDNNNYRRCS